MFGWSSDSVNVFDLNDESEGCIFLDFLSERMERLLSFHQENDSEIDVKLTGRELSKVDDE